jgi:hypothetical protein
MIGGIILTIAGLGALCVLLYNFAVYALPAYVGLSVGYWAISTGAGAVGGIAVGLVAGGMIFGVGQAISSTTRWAALRWIVILLFGIPAVIAGYSMMLHFSEQFGMPSPIWRHIFAAVAGAATGLTVVVRLGAGSTRPPSPEGVAPLHPRPIGSQRTMLVPERTEPLPTPRRERTLDRRTAGSGRP